jgi:3-methylcrotonyl-CoA carboxylase alpha subunit
MFSKLLIANRGEIACRVIATARRMGIATVAVYSDADGAARHVAMADEAMYIGPPPVAESYLRGAAIIDAALATGAQAIHPGYGFLSENPDFAEAVEATGLIFIGPPAASIRAMGLKDAAKRLMESTGVPVVPGYHGAEQDAGFLAAEAGRIGYPVLIKARAGGGGKGMRLVETPTDFADALASARREAQVSFGDAGVIVEKYVTTPRHIEVQVFADAHGNVIHTFERDCSLQRRHQKVIEEAPAPQMPQEVRAAMGHAATEAARAIGYRGAGTVEFIADGSNGLRADGFWFMEMNTRLQVEHPVSEAITGLDFVELQLRIAAGEPLAVLQEDLRVNGHAFEARLYAEDVAKGFLPATGCLDHLAFPPSVEFECGLVRVDSGVQQGDLISPWYDPMIAKIIVHGADRATALQRLEAALAATEVAGTVTNLAFLLALARNRGFANEQVDTGLIARDLEELCCPSAAPEGAALAAAIFLTGVLDRLESDEPWDRLRGFRAWGAGEVQANLLCGDRQVDIRLGLQNGAIFTENGDPVDVRQEPGAIVIGLQGRRQRLRFRRGSNGVTIFAPGQVETYVLVDPLLREARHEVSGNALASPMPGMITLLHVTAGQTVAAGEVLVVVEAMKMEHAIRAPRDGIVAEVAVVQGQQVGDGDILIVLESVDG